MADLHRGRAGPGDGAGEPLGGEDGEDEVGLDAEHRAVGSDGPGGDERVATEAERRVEHAVAGAELAGADQRVGVAVTQGPQALGRGALVERQAPARGLGDPALRGAHQRGRGVPARGRDRTPVALDDG